MNYQIGLSRRACAGLDPTPSARGLDKNKYTAGVIYFIIIVLLDLNVSLCAPTAKNKKAYISIMPNAAILTKPI